MRNFGEGQYGVGPYGYDYPPVWSEADSMSATLEAAVKDIGAEAAAKVLVAMEAGRSSSGMEGDGQ